MRVRTALLACLACLLAGAGASRAGGGIDVSYADGLVAIRCTHARLLDVLEQVASAAGMELILDKSVKSTPVTVEIEAQPVSLALERLLEGQGVTYAMSLAPDGQRVSQMYVASEAGGAKSAGGAPSAAGSRVPRGLPAMPLRPGARTPEPQPSPPVPALLTDDEEDDEIDPEIGDDDSPFAGLPAEAISGIPSSALTSAGDASPAAQPDAPAPAPTPLTFGSGTGGAGSAPAYYPVLDPRGWPIPVPRASPPAPTAQKPTTPPNQ